MADTNTIAAGVRDRAGKGAARATRRSGRVPAVIYGNKIEPALISIDPIELAQNLGRPGFFAHIFEVNVGGEVQRVIARDVQFDPVTDRPVHVDFMRFSASTKLKIEVEVRFLNEDNCPGLKEGGVLNVVRHTVELICSPDHIPECIFVDLKGLGIGDSMHISAVDLPSDVRPSIARDFTVATIAAPTLMPTEEEIAAETEEGVEDIGGTAESAEAKDGEEKADGEKPGE
jgi:large subunit ribosomal protein L25